MPDSDFTNLDALAFAGDRPAVSATIKEQFADFRVDEELGFEFTGSGEHLCVQLRKTDLSTPDVARRLSAVTGVPLAAIGYAGMKDRRGECSQWFSVQLPPELERQVTGIEDAAVTILQTHRNGRKLKIGSHKLNHFALRLRQCAGGQEAFEARLQQIREGGVPNYFGQQRFGRDMSNLTQVMALMRELEENTAAAKVKPAGRDFRRGMLYSAARSYLFNLVLSGRLHAGTWDHYVEGDVLSLNGTDRCFRVDPAGGWDAELEDRLRRFDIHLTGPLAGQQDPKDKYVSCGEAADIEEAVLQQFTTLTGGLKRCGLVAARRALRFAPKDLAWEWEDESVLQLRFSLSKGCYATSLLRELCMTNPGPATDRQ